MKERTLAEIVDSFYRRGSETAYVRRCGCRNLRWSYRQVAESAYQLARELQARGVHRGDRVFLWGEDCVEWVIAFLGWIQRGPLLFICNHITQVKATIVPALYFDPETDPSKIAKDLQFKMEMLRS